MDEILHLDDLKKDVVLSTMAVNCYKNRITKTKGIEMNCSSYRLFELIKASLWRPHEMEVSQQDYEEMKLHTIAGIPSGILPELILTSELAKEWREVALWHFAVYTNHKYVQDTLPLSVPYVILKGTSAAKYYPHPEYRTMGDIDIITRREDFDTAYRQLNENGYRPIKKLDREVVFVKNGIIIELHHYFASLNDSVKAKYLDDLIIENINSSHVLPDLVNGLVILEHISQHMEHGLGLRQIIDWMMFVHNCIPDDKWLEFQEMAQRIGMKELAVVATHMCEMYLGLPERSWCAGADEELCEQLMDYVMTCGNFGIKQIDDGSIVENVFSRARNPKATFRLLQERGLVNWRAAQKYRILRPFAWIYQFGRYILRGVRRDEALDKIKDEYQRAKQRNDMFDKLGVKQTANGLVTYKDGKYVKE